MLARLALSCAHQVARGLLFKLHPHWSIFLSQLEVAQASYNAQYVLVQLLVRIQLYGIPKPDPPVLSVRESSYDGRSTSESATLNPTFVPLLPDN